MINKIVETPSVFCNSKYNGVLEDENYKRFIKKEDRKRIIRIVVFSVLLLILIIVLVIFHFITPRTYHLGDIVKVDHITYEFVIEDPSYYPVYNDDNPGDSIVHSAYYKDMVHASSQEEIPESFIEDYDYTDWYIYYNYLVYDEEGNINNLNDIGNYYNTFFADKRNIKRGAFYVKSYDKDAFDEDSVIVIPGAINGVRVHGIGYNAFNGLNVDTVILPPSIFVMPKAFSNCNIKALIFGTVTGNVDYESVEGEYYAATDYKPSGTYLFPTAIYESWIGGLNASGAYIDFDYNGLTLLNQAISKTKITRIDIMQVGNQNPHIGGTAIDADWYHYFSSIESPFYDVEIWSANFGTNSIVVDEVVYLNNYGFYVDWYNVRSDIIEDIYVPMIWDIDNKPSSFVLFKNDPDTYSYNINVTDGVWNNFIQEFDYLSELETLYVANDSPYKIVGQDIYMEVILLDLTSFDYGRYHPYTIKEEHILAYDYVLYGRIPEDCEVIYFDYNFSLF